MIVRWFLILLLTLNVCYLLWGVLRPTPGQELPPQQRADHSQAGEAYSVSPLATPDTRYVCAMVGPFPDEALREQAIGLWAAHEPRALSRPEAGEALYRVHVTTDGDDRSAHLSDVREQLQAAGLDIGSFLITDGQLAGDVSLGLFRQHENAVDIQQRAADAGVTATIHEEREEHASLWLQLRIDQPDGTPLSTEELQDLHEGLQYTENLCETIAP